MKKKILLILLGTIVLIVAVITTLIYLDKKSREIIVHSLGDRISEGSVEIVVNSVANTTLKYTNEEIEKRNKEIEKQKNNRFLSLISVTDPASVQFNGVVLNITIRNKSKTDMIHIRKNNFSIITETEGTKFAEATDSMSSFAFNYDPQNLIDTLNLFPNTEKTGLLVFQTKEPVKNVRFTFFPVASDYTGFRGSIYDLVIGKG